MDVPSFSHQAFESLAAQSAPTDVAQQGQEQHQQHFPLDVHPHPYPDFDLVPSLLPHSQIANIDSNNSMHPQLQQQQQQQQQQQFSQAQPELHTQLRRRPELQEQNKEQEGQLQHDDSPLNSIFMTSPYDTSTSAPLSLTNAPLSLSHQFLPPFPTHQNAASLSFPPVIHPNQHDLFMASQGDVTIGPSTLPSADDFPISSVGDSPATTDPTKLPLSSNDSNQHITKTSTPEPPGAKPSASAPSRTRTKPYVNSTDKSTTSKETRNGRKRTRTRTEDMDPSLVHTCPTCGKKFAKKYNQKIHQRRHQGDLPFVCEYEDCGKGFMWRSSFLRHLKVHEARPERPRKAPRKSADTSSDAQSPNEVDVMQISENASIMLLNGMKVEVDHFGLESINSAVALCRLNGTSCRELLDINVDAIRKADEEVVATRRKYVESTKQTPLDLSNPQIKGIHNLLTKGEPNGAQPP